jgi:hypothetical protein
VGLPNPVPTTLVKMIRVPSGVQVGCTARGSARPKSP